MCIEPEAAVACGEVFSMGLLIGVQIPKKNHKAVKIGAAIVFVGTYIPLMAKYAKILLDKRN